MGNGAIKVLLLEDEEKYRKDFKDFFDNSDDFELLGMTDSATEALELVKTTLPQALIVDLQLTKGEGDGIDFIERAREIQKDLPIRPYILVTTKVSSEPIMNKLNKGRADFIYSKDQRGYSASSVGAHLIMMSDCFDCSGDDASSSACNKSVNLESSQDKSVKIYNRVKSELSLFCIGPNLIGRDYLIEAIMLAIEKSEDEARMTKIIYPAIGKKYGKTKESVERNIRTVIQKAFSKTDIDTLGKLYKEYLDPDKGYPTNGEFIKYFADKLRKGFK